MREVSFAAANKPKPSASMVPPRNLRDDTGEPRLLPVGWQYFPAVETCYFSITCL